MAEKHCVLACVTAQKNCEKLIRRGKELAEESALPLRVLHISSGKNALGSPQNAEILDALFSLAHEVDADMNILHDPDVPAAIVRYAKDCGASVLVLGPDRSGTAGKVLRLLPPGVSVVRVD